MTPSLHGPLNDLAIARQAIEAMTTATQFTAFYQSWQDFLIRIERSWEAAERGLKSAPGFQEWFRPYAHQKRHDPLLRFLFQARNAETHAVGATMDRPLRLALRDKYGHPFRLRQLGTTLDQDGVLTIEIDTAPEDSLLSYEVINLPSPPTLVRFCNRGRWYEPPTTHLGNTLQSVHPVAVANHGLAFYGSFVQEAEYRFLKRPIPSNLSADSPFKAGG